MAHATLETQVYNWVAAKLNHRVGNGECAELASQALQALGAKTFFDLGPTGSGADYVWGTPIDILKVQPGDILQYRNYSATTSTSVKTTTYHRDGRVEWQTSSNTTTSGAPHHTAVAASAFANGGLDVFEQNYQLTPNGPFVKTVRRTRYLFRAGPPRHDSQTTYLRDGSRVVTETSSTTTVSGSVWAYRPVQR